MVIGKIKGEKVSPSLLAVVLFILVHISCFLPGQEKASSCPFHSRRTGWFHPFPSLRFRFFFLFITIYSRTSGTSSYAALLWPNDSEQAIDRPRFRAGRISILRTAGQMVRTLLSTPQKLAPPANFSIYFTPIGSSRVENGANPFRWLESMTDLSYIGWICEPRLIGNAKEISRTDPPRKELDDFSSRNEQRKDESEWINARTDRSGQTWPNRFATSKNRESRMLWSARGIATVITRPDTNHGPSFIQGHSYEIV